MFDQCGFNAALGLREAGRESEATCDAGVRERKPARGCRRDTELGHALRRKNRELPRLPDPTSHTLDLAGLEQRLINEAVQRPPRS